MFKQSIDIKLFQMNVLSNARIKIYYLYFHKIDKFMSSTLEILISKCITKTSYIFYSFYITQIDIYSVLYPFNNRIY